MLVETRTKLINHVRGLVKALGHRVRSCDADQFAAVATSSLPAALGAAVEPVLEMIVALTEQLAVLDRAIESIAATSYAEEVRRLTQVHGVGALTALTFVLTLNDPARFPQSRRVGAYLGLVPRLDQSGEVNRQLGITHAGETYLRTLLVGSAQTILRDASPDTDLKRYGLRVMERGGKYARQRAAVAVARKLSVLLHRLWIRGETYVPVGYGKVHAQAA
jgi:transposase